MRTFTREYDGLQLTVAALTMKRIKAFNEQPLSRKQLIIDSLNAAAKSPDDRWDANRFDEQFDPQLIDRLYTEMMEFSGVILKAGAAAPGEAQAASDDGSTISAAASSQSPAGQ